jgi:serine/threonine-protein kinase
MATPLHERVVDALGHLYHVESEIGRGGMSVVYRARDPRLNRLIAIKVLPPELAYDPAIRTRFTREAQTSAQLAHAHIVPIYDVGDRDGLAYFVMSHVGGGNVATLLAEDPRPPLETVRRLLIEIADALAYAHLRGVIHRDVKPDNILLDDVSGRAMVTDFGIARAIEAGSRLTLTGIAVGTPTYMSPEQAMGDRDVDGRSDIYSLGVLGYQMLTGRVPFSAGNSMALLLKHVGEQPRPIAELRPNAPRALRDVIERALAKAPEDRWPTAESMRDAIISDRVLPASWRQEQRDPVRYTSPRAEVRAVSPRRGSAAAGGRSTQPSPARRDAGGAFEMEPEHLAPLTAAQREDLRLWHGHVNLFDRIKAMRRYLWLTLGMTVLGLTGFAAGVEEFPPLVVSPLVPAFMSVKLWRRGRSLRRSGLRLRRVLLMPRAKWVLPRPPRLPKEQQLSKLAPREILESTQGAAIRRANDERAAILELVAKLPKADRALLPDVVPTVNALVERVAHVAQSMHRLDESIDPRAIHDLDARIAELDGESESVEGERRLALLRRQRAILDEIAARRAALARQLDSAGLALGNLRLDLVKFRSSGLQSALSDVSSATQQARALSHEIGAVLEAAAEMRDI